MPCGLAESFFFYDWVDARKVMTQSRKRFVGVLTVVVLIGFWAILTPFRDSIEILAFSCLCLFYAPRLRSVSVGSGLLMVGTVGLVIGFFDLGLRWYNRSEFKPEYAGDYLEIAAGLGKKPAGPGVFRSTGLALSTGESVYYVSYGIDRFGFRQSPRGPIGAPTFLFFGCSFTYGEGLDDDQTFPVQFAKEIPSQPTIVNLAFHGYGPHQMLFMLRHGIPDGAITGAIAAVFYLAIPDHVNRASGAHYWNVHSPHFEPESSGLVLKGLFSDDPYFAIISRLESAGGVRAEIGRAVYMLRRSPAVALSIWGDIVQESSRIVRERYGVELLVLVWDGSMNEQQVVAMLTELSARGIRTVRVSALIGQVDQPQYLIRPGVEHHPSAFANQRLGQALARTWVTEMAGRSAALMRR